MLRHALLALALTATAAASAEPFEVDRHYRVLAPATLVTDSP